MSAVSPEKKDYQTPDGLKVAQDIAWVIKSMWGLAFVFAVAIAWGVTLANDVKANTEKLKTAPEQHDVETIVSTLERLERKIDSADTRQRQIQQSQARLEQKVDDLEKKVDEQD